MKQAPRAGASTRHEKPQKAEPDFAKLLEPESKPAKEPLKQDKATKPPEHKAKETPPDRKAIASNSRLPDQSELEPNAEPHETGVASPDPQHLDQVAKPDDGSAPQDHPEKDEDDQKFAASGEADIYSDAQPATPQMVVPQAVSVQDENASSVSAEQSTQTEIASFSATSPIAAKRSGQLQLPKDEDQEKVPDTGNHEEPPVNDQNDKPENKISPQVATADNGDHDYHIGKHKPSSDDDQDGARKSDAKPSDPSTTAKPPVDAVREYGPQTSVRHDPAQALTPSPLPTDAPIPRIPLASVPIEIGLRALEGKREISIDLAPEDLGHVNIVISVGDQSPIQISFTAAQPHTLSLLQNDAHQIRHALEQAGFQTQDSSLQFSLQQDFSSNSNSSQQDGGRAPAKPASALPHEGRDAPSPVPPPIRVSLSQLDLSV